MPEANVLSKKLRQGGVARSPLSDTDLVSEGFARGVEDRLRSLVKTMTSASVGAARVTKLAEATGSITAPAMLGVIEVEDADTPALLALESTLAFHLIDLTLGGDPASLPEPVTRSFTAIDLALGRLHLDAILEAFVHAVGLSLGKPLTKAVRIRDQRQNLSQLRIAPDYIDVLYLTARLTLGEAGRNGGLGLILPLSALDVIRASVQVRNQQAARDRPNDLWKTLMRRAAAAAPVRVDAVLHRQPLSLAALQDLHVGQVLEIPRQAVDEIRLTLSQPAGRTALLAMGQLGAFQENKVVRLVSPPDRRVITHLERALSPSVVAAEAPEAAPAPAPVPASRHPDAGRAASREPDSPPGIEAEPQSSS